MVNELKKTRNKDMQDKSIMTTDGATNMIEDKLLTVEDVADFFKITEEEAKEVLEQGGVPIVRSGDSIQIFESNLAAYVRKNSFPAIYWPNDKLLTVKNVAKIFHISEQDTEEILKQDGMPIIYFKNSIRILREDLNLYLDELRWFVHNLLNVGDVASYLSVSESRAKKWFENQELPCLSLEPLMFRIKNKLKSFSKRYIAPTTYDVKVNLFTIKEVADYFAVSNQKAKEMLEEVS